MENKCTINIFSANTHGYYFKTSVDLCIIKLLSIYSIMFPIIMFSNDTRGALAPFAACAFITYLLLAYSVVNELQLLT